MIYLFILIYLILVPGTMLIMLYQIINKLEEIKNRNNVNYVVSDN